MDRHIRSLELALFAGALLAPAVSPAQSLPKPKPPAAAHQQQSNPKDCVNTRTTEGSGKSGDVQVEKPSDQSLSNQLAQSNGVICPPSQVDPEMKKPAPGGGKMPVIPPPGVPGGKPGPQPK